MSAAYMRRCARKQRHETKEGACGQRAALVASKKLRTDQLSVYRCDQCLGWHVGGTSLSFASRHKAKRPNKRMRGRL